MKRIRRVLGLLLLLIAAYLFARGLSYGAFLTGPFLIFGVALWLLIEPSERGSRRLRALLAKSRMGWLGLSLLLIAVVWVAVAARISVDPWVVWGGGIVIGLAGVAFLAYDHMVQALRQIRRDRDSED